MRHPSPSSSTPRTLLVALIRACLLLGVPAAALAQVVVPVGAFRSVTLRNGGVVILRHAPTQRVRLLKGAEAYTRATIVEGDRLVIDRFAPCPRGLEPTVEVSAPALEGITVMDGGVIQSSGRFPRQAELLVAVESGGMIDLRSMAVGRVTAAVNQGGRIYARPEETLDAKIAQGGAVTYWGNPRVTSSIKHGGVVERGAAADADRPLVEMGPQVPELPAPPALPAPRSKARKPVRGTI